MAELLAAVFFEGWELWEFIASFLSSQRMFLLEFISMEGCSFINLLINFLAGGQVGFHFHKLTLVSNVFCRYSSLIVHK